MQKPTVALVLGDPAGIGPELVAKVLSKESQREKANILIIADKEELQKGMKIAQLQFPYEEITEDQLPSFSYKTGIPVLISYKSSNQQPFEYGKSTKQSGEYILETLKKAVEYAQAGYAQSICFAPLNKQAMHLGGLQYRDELHWFAEQTDFHGFVCELNVVDDIWAIPARIRD